jgi:KipI family sensor histidine kinase inhibitor
MHPAQGSYPRLHALGEAAWIVEFGDSIDEATHARVMGFAPALAEGKARGAWRDVLEWVPAGTTLTVHFTAAGAADVALDAAEALLALARAAPALSRPGRRWRLPVCFDAEFAPDLEDVAAARGLSAPQVIELMTGTAFRVYMLGFQPGFAYMGGLPAALAMARRATPRVMVPQRSLAVAGRMCAVYPWPSPGGWHLLGRTPLALFDAARTAEPAWLRPGDEVHWIAIDRARFDALERDSAAGTMQRDAWLHPLGAAP